MLKRFLIYLKDIRKIQLNSTPLPSYWAFCLIKILLQLLSKDYGIFPGSMQTPGSFFKTRISNPPEKQQPKRCADITGRSWQQGRSIVTGSTAGKRQRLMTPPLTQLGHIPFLPVPAPAPLFQILANSTVYPGTQARLCNDASASSSFPPIYRNSLIQ